MPEKLYVCFTMDVERIKSKSPTGGPPSWEFAERSVRDYCGYLLEHDYRATLFIVPDTAEKQPDLFGEMHAGGHECGLHFHAQSWRENYKRQDEHDYLGGYGADQQDALLREVKRQWTDALGFAPLTFRPGNFSANDQTFQVLESLGFTCGSVSQPGRNVPRIKASWVGARRDVHRAHEAFRLVAGDLDFIEVPGTTDANRTDHWTGIGDARLENWTAPDILQAAEDALNWQQKQESPIRHLCLFTHNFVNYGEAHAESETRRPVLKGVVEQLPALAARYGLTPEGCTISALREHYVATEEDVERARGSNAS